MAATWSFVGAGAGVSYASTASVVLSPPAGALQGDLLISVIGYGGNTVWTDPTGWYHPTATEAAVVSLFFGWHKLPGAPLASYSFGCVPNITCLGLILCYRGAEFTNDYTGAPVFPAGNNGVAPAAPTTITTTSIAVDDLHFCVWTAAGASHTIASDAALTQRFSFDAGGQRICGGEEALATTTVPARTATGSPTFWAAFTSVHGDAKFPGQLDAWAWV